MPSPKSAFPAPPQYPPLSPKPLTANERVARDGGRSYASASGVAAKTVEILRTSHGGGRASLYGSVRRAQP